MRHERFFIPERKIELPERKLIQPKAVFPMPTFMPGSLVPVTFHALSALASDPANASSYTFNSLGVGAANGQRTSFALLSMTQGFTPVNVTGVTIGGLAATLLHSTGALVGVSYFLRSLIYGVALPTGTTANVGVSLSAAALGMACTIMSFLDCPPLMAYDTGSYSSGATTTPSVSIDKKGKGLTIGFLSDGSGANTATWSGVTENVDNTWNDGTQTIHVTAGYDLPVSDAANQSVGATLANSRDTALIGVSL